MHLNDVTGPAVSSAERDLRSAPTSCRECARFCGSRTFEAGFEENKGRPLDANKGRPLDANKGRPLDANKGRPLDAIAWRMYNGSIDRSRLCAAEIRNCQRIR
jgi:hypothetical protein